MVVMRAERAVTPQKLELNGQLFSDFLFFFVFFYGQWAVRARIPSGWQLQYLMLRRGSLLRVLTKAAYLNGGHCTLSCPANYTKMAKYFVR